MYETVILYAHVINALGYANELHLFKTEVILKRSKLSIDNILMNARLTGAHKLCCVHLIIL